LVKHDKELGKNYITSPAFDLQKCYDDSSNITPIIFILSPGADPMSELKKLAESPNLRKKWEQLSLGQGQAKKAVDAITLAMEQQTWVVLQNCHLSPSFMP
jgi:dynein heavy chain